MDIHFAHVFPGPVWGYVGVCMVPKGRMHTPPMCRTNPPPFKRSNWVSPCFRDGDGKVTVSKVKFAGLLALLAILDR